MIEAPPAQDAAPPPVVAHVWDLTVGLIEATVQLDQPSGPDTRTVGTGFLIQAPRPDGTPRMVLVTAAHVLERMPDPEARIGWRTSLGDGTWRFDPEPLTIRDGEGHPLWTQHPDRDVAVMEVAGARGLRPRRDPAGLAGGRERLRRLGGGAGRRTACPWASRAACRPTGPGFRS